MGAPALQERSFRVVGWKLEQSSELNAHAWCTRRRLKWSRQGIEVIGDPNHYYIETVERSLGPGPGGRKIIGMRIACLGQHEFLKSREVIKQTIPREYRFGVN